MVSVGVNEWVEKTELWIKVTSPDREIASPGPALYLLRDFDCDRIIYRK